MKKQWKKCLSVILCIAMVLSCNAQVFAVGIDISDNGTYLDEKQSDVKSEMSDVYETVEIANVESHAKIKPPELQKTVGDASMAHRQQEAAQTFTEITEEIERFLRRNHSGRGSFTAQV